MTNNERLAELLYKMLEHETSEEVLEIKRQLLRRVALESEIHPSRIPAPRNITEIGGYFNLLMKLNQDNMLRQTLSAILGLPMQTPME